MYENILFPYDGSDGAKAVLQHAAGIADWADATLNLLFVADTTQDSVTRVGGDVVDSFVRRGEETLAEATNAIAPPRIEYETDVVQGNPAPTIVEYAERYDQDLIVMPTRGREGLSRYVVGSVSEKVLRLSSLPVLVVRMRPDEQLAFPYETVLLPTDGGTAATKAAQYGLALAEAFDADVHVLSVVEDGGLGPDVRSTIAAEETSRAARDAVDDVVADAEARDIPSPTTRVTRGSPSEEIREYVESNAIDAVVMGTTGRRGTERILLGSVAERTVRSVPVPVFAIPRDGAD